MVLIGKKKKKKSKRETRGIKSFLRIGVGIGALERTGSS